MNTTEMVRAIQIKGSFPTSDDLFSTSDYLVILNLQMKSDITPTMLRLNEEFFLRSKDFTISASTRYYRMPTRTVGAKLRDLKRVDSNGVESDLNRLYEEDRPLGRTGYYMTGNSIELSSDIQSGTLRMKYFVRPSTLVETSSCAQVTVIDTSANTIEVSSAPSTFANGSLVDFVQNLNPYDLLDMDVAISNISGTTLTFASIPNGLTVGDWICVATESPVPMVPDEMHPILVQSALLVCLSSKKDKIYEQEKEMLIEMRQAAINMLEPRVENSSAKMRAGTLYQHWFS